jgi:hypothetical protein
VDLRTVGKRALESLIKVGAMDTFGPRSAMLSMLDQILSISASHFRASDAGQMSIFGASTGLSDEITIPKNALEANRREILEWERELIGLYVSDHPLSPVMDALAQVVTHFSGQLSEASPGDKVRVAGIVTRVRPHQTKTGKSMGFVTLEDVSGTIELVVFPRTWDKFWEVFEVDNVVLVDGKVDAQSGDPKVLVDSVTTDLKTITDSPPPTPPQGDQNFRAAISTTKITLPSSEPLSEEEDWGDMPTPPDNFISDWQVNELAPGGFVVERGVISTEAPNPEESGPQLSAVGREPANSSISGTPSDTEVQPSTISSQLLAEPNEQVTETSEESLTEISMETPLSPVEPMIPIPPEVEIPAGGGITISSPTAVVAVLEPSISPSQSEPDVPIVTSESTIASPSYISKARSNTEVPASETEVPAALAEVPEMGTVSTPPYILPPTEAYAGEDLHMITVILRPGGDKVRDNLRLRQCYGILISYSGHDRFALQIFERSRGYRIEFPNYTTTYCAELVARLGRIVGQDNVIVEPLRLH